MSVSISRGVTIIEERGSGASWLHDPEDINLSNFTDGDTYMAIPDTFRFQKRNDAEFKVTRLVKGRSMAFPMEKRGTIYEVQGAVYTVAAAKACEQFFTKHTLFSDEPIFLVMRHASNSYEETFDHDRVAREYTRGLLKSMHTEFIAAHGEKWVIKFIFESVWWGW